MHLSDTWASIGHQCIPSAWIGKNVEQEAYNYAKDTLQRMIDAGVKPDMVQCGNENNSRVSGQTISNRNAFVGILNACNRAVRELAPDVPLVAQHGKPRPAEGFAGWVDSLLGASPTLDVDAVCGSTYGTTNNGGDWREMFGYVINRYNKPVLSCEYTDNRRDLINPIMREFPNGMGWGTFLWEPVVYDRPIFDRNNAARRFTPNARLAEYIRVAQASGI
ncbi:MAG TPA: glycosyl hydrolase 53 family protein, partial [Marinagarivorans sp.]